MRRQIKQAESLEARFIPLTPITLQAEHEQYDKALSFALDNANNPNIRNIAVAGGYGSGKSTFLQSFQYKFPKYQYTTVSLATFKGEVETTATTSDNSEQNTIFKEIESSILQQLLYKVPAEKLPHSRITKITHLSRWKTMAYTCLLLATGASYWQLSNSNNALFERLGAFRGLLDDLPHFIFEGVLLSVILFGAYRLLTFIQQSNLTRFVIKDGKVDTYHGQSFLNKNIDELIYFFQKTRIEVVIFEDLDRFNNVEIFNKLREINKIINDSLAYSPVYFVYAIRDELFSARDRTKFFDFIIPIVPVVHPENAYEVLAKELRVVMGASDTKASATKKNATHANENTTQTSLLPSKSLLVDVSYFLDDARLIKNIANEFAIYFGQLNRGKHLTSAIDKVFAMMCVKNCYPKHFAELLREQGAIYEVFDNKGRYIDQRIAEIDRKIEVLEQDLKRKKDILPETEQEAKVLIWWRLAKKAGVSNPQYLYYEGKPISESEFINVFSLESLQLRNTYFVNQMGHHAGSPLNTVDVQKEFSDLTNFKQRFSIDKDEEKIASFKEEQQSFYNATLAQLMSSDAFTLFKPAKNDATTNYLLLEYFIKQGLLAEDYRDYLAYFREGRLTLNDKTYLQAVKVGKASQKQFVTARIDDPHELLENRLVPSEFHDQVINHQLLAFLLKSAHANEYDPMDITNNDYLKICIWDKGEKYARALLEDSVLSPEAQPHFYQAMYHYKPDWLSDLLTYFELTFRSQYCADMVSALTTEQLQHLSEEFDLSLTHTEDITPLLSFSEHGDLADTSRLNLAKLVDLSVKFEYLNSSSTSLKHWQILFENGLVELNWHNLQSLHASLVKAGNISQEQPVSYQMVLQCDFPIFQDFVEQNINHFMQCLFESGEVLYESANSFIALLNHEQITEDNAFKACAAVLSETIDDITAVKNPQFWDALFNISMLSPTWENVQNYYDIPENFNPGSLQAYLENERVYTILAKQPFPEEMYEYDVALCEWICDKSTALYIESFKAIIPQLTKNQSFCKFEQMPEECIEIVIAEDKAPYNPKAVEYLTKHNIENGLLYFERYVDEYMAREYAQIPLSSDLFWGIMQSETFLKEQKLQITFAQLPHLLDKYQSSKNTKKYITSNVSAAIEQGKVANDIKLSELVKLCEFSDLSEREKIVLVTANAEHLERSGIAECLSKVNHDLFEPFITGEGRYLRLPDSVENRGLLEALQKQGFIGKINRKQDKLLGYLKKINTQTQEV